jgi:hypothetical protein
VVYAEQPAGFLFEPNSLFVQPVSVPKGQEYKLTITNTHEDGINDPGYVAVYYGSQAATENEIVTATTIETPRTEIVFSVRSKTSPSTSTLARAGPVQSGDAPFCIPQEENKWIALDNRHKQSPLFLKERTVFPRSSCEQHDNLR